MAYTALTLLMAARTGLSIADAALHSADAGGNSFVNDGFVILVFQNTNGASRTVTVATPGLVDVEGGSGLDITERTITLPATTGRLVTSTWPRTIYNQSDGTVHVDYSAVAGVLVAAIQIPREVNR